MDPQAGIIGRLSQAQIDRFQKESIADFFSRLGEEYVHVTEQSCIELANELLGATDARAMEHQGSSSFTLISADADKVVQYRRFPFEQDILDLAQVVYEDLTPKMTRYKPDYDFPFTIYIVEVAHGSPMGLHDWPTGDLPFEQLLRTSRDLAKFIGRAVRFPQASTQTADDGWTRSAPTFLDRLTSSKVLRELAPELMPIIAEAKRHVHLLDILPLVLTHQDHGMINLLVDPHSGELNAVLDWDWGRVEAFGMTIYGFYEDFTARREGDEIFFFDQLALSGRAMREELEKTFWEQLWRSVEGYLSVEEHGKAVRTAAVIGAMNRFLDLETLNEIDQRGAMDPDNWDHVSMMLRSRSYLPKLPQIDQES